MAATVTVRNNTDGDLGSQSVSTLREFHGSLAWGKIAADLGKRDFPAKVPWQVVVSGTVTCNICSKSKTVSTTWTA